MPNTTHDVGRELALLQQTVANLDRCINGNGKPGLEDRIMGVIKQMRKEIDLRISQVDRHSNANAEQGDVDVLEAVKRETAERERQHRENKEMALQREEERKEREAEEKKERAEIKQSVNRLTQLVGAIAIAIAIIESLEKFGIIHFAG